MLFLSSDPMNILACRLLSNILNSIENRLSKPGWVRLSLHPVMTDKDVCYFVDALKEIVANHTEWKKDYIYNPKKNEFEHCSATGISTDWIQEWFNL